MIGPPAVGAKVVPRFAVPVQRVRYAAAAVNADGLKVQGAPTVETVRVRWYPAPGEVVQALPRGAQPYGTIRVHATFEIRGPAGGVRADAFRIDGVEYQVVGVEFWGGGPSGAVQEWVATCVETRRGALPWAT